RRTWPTSKRKRSHFTTRNCTSRFLDETYPERSVFEIFGDKWMGRLYYYFDKVVYNHTKRVEALAGYDRNNYFGIVALICLDLTYSFDVLILSIYFCSSISCLGGYSLFFVGLGAG